MIEKIKNHPRNKNIEFDSENHLYFYTCDGRKKQFNGVTSMIANYHKPFDPKIAKFIAYRDGVTEEEVLATWGKARGYGNYVDKLIGEYIEEGKHTEHPEVENFIKALKEKNLTPLVSEWVIYDESIERASGVDVICLNEDNELVIIDLKSMEKTIKKEGYKGACMSHPISNLPDAKFYKQALQVNMYHKWIKENYDLPVADEKYVLRIRPEFYKWLELPNLQDEINKIYEFEQD